MQENSFKLEFSAQRIVIVSNSLVLKVAFVYTGNLNIKKLKYGSLLNF